MGPKSNESVLIGDRHTERTERRNPCENRGRDWKDAATSQGSLEPLEAEEKRKGSPFQKEHGPANTSTLDFWPPELWENKYVLYLWNSVSAVPGHYIPSSSPS